MNLNYSHLPAWVTSNRLFRNLFLLRKLYLTKATFRHHSQFAEDVSIVRLFDKSYRGFFVDVGCFHPKKYNNTWQLYRRGWRGINVDIDSIKTDGFKIARPGDISIASAVSNTSGEATCYSSGFYSLTTSLDKDFAANKAGYQQQTIQCRTLSQIIDETKFKNREIDFLSVDTEGHDLQVLQSLDFNRYKPKLIAIEIHYALFSEVCGTALYQHLQSQDYCLVGWCGLTLLLASPALQQRLASAPAATTGDQLKKAA